MQMVQHSLQRLNDMADGGCVLEDCTHFRSAHRHEYIAVEVVKVSQTYVIHAYFPASWIKMKQDGMDE